MDATNVLSQLTNTWSNCLDQYYDHVAEEHMKVISEKYDIPMNDLMLKSKELKENIMKKLTNCMSDKKEVNTKKEVNSKKESTKKTKSKEEGLESLGRKELHELCKERNIPTKRKNSDMVSAIQEFDLKNKVAEPEQEVPMAEEPVVQKQEEAEVEEEVDVEEEEVDVEEEEVEEDDEEVIIEYNNMNLNDDELHEDEYINEDE